jgi:hypothetical protein
MRSSSSKRVDWAKFLNKAQEIWGEQMEENRVDRLKLGNKMREIQMCKNEEPRMKHRAFDKDGDELHENDVIVDFREESWKFISILPDGKVYAQSMKNRGDRRIFFPSVFKITVQKEAE